MRRDLTAISKRVEKMRQRARLLVLPPLVTTCTGAWDKADRLAYATADEAERSRLENAYLGPLPEHPDPLGIRGIVVVLAERPPDDDDEADLPGDMTAEQYAEAKRRREQTITEMQVEAPLEAERQPVAETDPRDPNPDGDPAEILYVDERTGYPVSRRTSAQARASRRAARTRCVELHGIQKGRMMTEKKQAILRAIIPMTKLSGYVSFEPVPHYGRMNGSQIVEAGDEAQPRYVDGYEELRREALKAKVRH